MLKVRDFLALLPEEERKTLANRLGAGQLNAWMAAQCLTDPGPESQDVAQLLAYLSDAIRQLEDARELVRQRV